MFEEKLYKRAPSYLHPLGINFPLLLVSIGFYMETKVFGPISAGFKNIPTVAVEDPLVVFLRLLGAKNCYFSFRV